MKKIYATFLLFISALALNAQTNDTLTLHWQGTYTIFSSQGGGFVVGHNGYQDKAKMQLFDAAYGVSGSGIITGILMAMPWVEGNPNSVITATIWADNSGVPGTVLGTVDVPYGNVDTSNAGFMQVVNALDTVFYNLNAVFPTPISIPSNGKFWAGFSFTYAAGDTIGLYSTADGEFGDAATHTFEKWSDNTYHSFNDGTSATWQLDIALAIFPTVTFGVGINEATPENDNVALYQNFPNPFSTLTNISYSVKKSGNVSVDVLDLTGRKVMTRDLGYKTAGNYNFNLNAGSLNSGIYFYTLTTNGSSVTRRMTVSK